MSQSNTAGTFDTLTRWVLVAFGICAAPASLASAAEPQAMADEATRPAPVRVVIPLGVQTATIPALGAEVEFPCEEVWKPICGTGQEAVTVADLALMAGSHAAIFSDLNAEIIVVDESGGARAGVNVVFQLSGNVPAAAIPAMATAEAYIEGQFPNDPITVTIPVSFASLPPGVIGGTSSSSGYVAWADTRSVLQSGADGSDTILSFLPSGTTIPVRYRSNQTTNETRVFWTFANFKASGGTVSGNDASMQFSTSFPFDYDPSNGVSSGTISFQDVVIHETGHALGFTSGIDFRVNDIEVLDVFRFRNSDGNGDFNPDTDSEFQVRPRWAVYNYNDDYNFDIISAQYRLADGSPWQASHFREQAPAIGIMDPAINYAETFYPNFYRTSDVAVFDAIGYDR